MGTTERDQVLAGLVGILEDMTCDWDMDFSSGIGADTTLVEDLGFESIDIVQLVVAIEKHFKRRGLPFEELLMSDGSYKDDIRVSDTVDFLYRHLNKD